MRAIVAMAVTLIVSAGVLVPAPSVTAEDPALVLRVGGQDEMKTRNLLPTVADDVWTTDVLERVYQGPLLDNPVLGVRMAYIAKGIDSDEDGVFEPNEEYDVWGERANGTTPLEVVVYYDFNGVRWHDATQMTVWDLFFSYHLSAMNPRFETDFQALFAAGASSTYESGGRQLNIVPEVKSWQGEGTMGGDPTLRVALRFSLTEPFARFSEETLSPVLLPVHEWSRTGGGRHGDFGCAVWVPSVEAAAKGIPECGTPDPSKWGKGIAATEVVPGSQSYQYGAAESWALRDSDVIGSGPFRLAYWFPGIATRVTRNDAYYVGGGFDPILAGRVRLPRITSIEFRVYRTTQLGVFALQSGEIDFYHWNVGAEFAPDLLKYPGIAVVTSPEMRVFSVWYNMRNAPWGYEGNSSTDIGIPLRKAFVHAMDKRSAVQNLLQNFGVVAHGFISPSNTFWYNDSIPEPAYDLAVARAILDDVATPGGQYYDSRYSTDPAGTCNKDNDAGCRSLPGIGNTEFEILTPETGYDSWRYSVSSAWAQALRQIGINALSKPTAIGEIINRMTSHDFSLSFLTAIRVTDPDALFSFFHSSNAAQGFNFGGVADPELDLCLKAGRREMNRERRRDIYFGCQQILGDLRPVEPVLFRTNVESYRQDRFINWTVLGGTIWNYWSLIGIRPAIPLEERLTVLISAPSAMFADATENLVATVRDPLGLAVSDARLTLQVNQGTLSVAGASGQAVQAVTDVSGQAFGTFTAPIVAGNTTVILDAVASHPDFHDSLRAFSIIQVFPPGERFLSIMVELPLGDLVSPGNVLPVSVEVRDQDRTLVPDAVVNVTTTDEGLLWPNPTNGTAADLRSILLEAAGSITNVTSLSVTVNASLSGYFDAQMSFAIHVLPLAATYRCATGEIVRNPSDCPPPRRPEDASPVVLTLAGAIAATSAAALVLLRWRSKRVKR